MPLNFSTASQSSAAQGVKTLIYGGAGVGKTVLTATMPSPVLISAESGLLSLRQKNLEKLFGVGNPSITYNMPVLQVTSIADMTDIYNWLTRSAEARGFQSVGLDSISEIAETVLNNAKRSVKDPRQAYGLLLEHMESMVRSYRDMPNKHVMFSAKMEPVKNELDGSIKFMPSMPGTKLGPKLPYFFDEVFRIGINRDQAGNNYRFLQTQPDLQYEAKDRSGALDPLEMPHMTHIINKVLGA